MTTPIFKALALTALSSLLCASAALAATPRDTRISLRDKGVNGAPGQRLSGDAFVRTPGSWKRLTRDGARTSRFKVPAAAGCAVEVLVTARGVASRSGPLTRIRSVTRRPRAVIGQGRSTSGAWRIVHLRGGADAYKEVVTSPYRQDPADVYGLAALRVGRARWVDVRALAWFDGCTVAQTRRGTAAKALASMVSGARVAATIVRR